MVVLRHSPALISIALYLYQLRPVQGFLGHDYTHYMARILVGVDHVIQNGLFSLPHFSARLGGGLPQFADPQNIYFSLPQWLAFVVDPLIATYLSIALFLLAGYFGFYFLLKDECRASLPVLGGLVFLWNGFAFANIFVGHMTHLGFFLIPWLLWALNDKQRSFLFRTCFAAFIVIYLYLSGSKHVLLIAMFTVLLFLPLLIRRKGREVFRFVGLVGVLCLLVLSGKMMAEWRYSEHFILHGLNLPRESILQVLRRYYIYSSHLPEALRFGRTDVGCWEYTGYVSVVVLVGWASLMGRWRVVRTGWVAWTVSLGVFVALLAYGRPLNGHLPVFRHYHLPIKWFAAFIPLLIYGGIKGLDLCSLKMSQSLFIICTVFVVAEGFLSSQYFQRQHWARDFYYDKRSVHFPFPPVTQITANVKSDVVQLPLGQSSLRVYEPLFGYRREKMRHRLTPGESRITHPGCLVYARELGCEPWSTLSFAETEEFRRGRNGVEWVPAWQKNLFYANGFWLLVILMGLVKGLRWRKGFGWQGFRDPTSAPTPQSA